MIVSNMAPCTNLVIIYQGVHSMRGREARDDSRVANNSPSIQKPRLFYSAENVTAYKYK